MAIIFDDNAQKDDVILRQVETFLSEIQTIEFLKKAPTIIYQDGKSKGYYIKTGIISDVACSLLDTNAKLAPTDESSFRANRELLLDHNTFKRMVTDAKEGREFNDIIVEYNKAYSSEKPLKIWGGQHRAKAIQQAKSEAGVSRCHGFRIYFNLTKQQRTELALISNTNIAVSNDLFDRLQEETFVGLKLRGWCYQVGLLKEGEDFPDLGSKSESITVKLARTFVVNFYRGKEAASGLQEKQIDLSTYEPYLCESGASLDPNYLSVLETQGDSIWKAESLKDAGKAFATLHKAQFEAIKNSRNISNLKGFRNKAVTESVLSAWAFVAGLLQKNEVRLQNHYSVPKTTNKIPDPLNARDMANFKHDSDEPTYRGLGTRSSLKERQRMAQLFLARSLEQNKTIDKELMDKAVSQVVVIKLIPRGYTS